MNPFWKREKNAQEAFLANKRLYNREVPASERDAGAQESTQLLTFLSHHGLETGAQKERRRGEARAAERYVGERRGGEGRKEGSARHLSLHSLSQHLLPPTPYRLSAQCV